MDAVQYWVMRLRPFVVDPFRFGTIDDAEIVLRNDVGEEARFERPGARARWLNANGLPALGASHVDATARPEKRDEEPTERSSDLAFLSALMQI